MDTTYIKNDRLGRITLEYLAQAKNIVSDIWEKASNFFNSYQWRETLFDLKLISLIVSLAFAGLIIFLLMKTNAMGKAQRAALAEKNFSPTVDKKKIAKKWKKIEKELISDSPESCKLAVLEADELFEEALKFLGKVAEIRITNMDEIKEAKKIKINIIDNSGLDLTKEEAERAVRAYKKGLTDLGAI